MSLRRSRMTYVTKIAALGLMASVTTDFLYPGLTWPGPVTLALALLMLLGAIATRLEVAP